MSTSLPPSPRPERRQGGDRRARKTPLLSRFLFVGRRRRGRREGEQQNIYVDNYGRDEWTLALLIMGLSTADLILTLIYISLGGGEANPIMAAVLEHGEGAFVGVKFSVTALGALFLLAHSRFRYVKSCLAGLVGAYALLIVYHFVTWVPMVLTAP